MKLLVVEDDQAVAALLRTGLTRHGFEVVAAGTAREALDRLSPAPDVVLLDLGLPDRNGFTLCGQIRRATGAPIIMVTGRGDARSKVHGLNLGADDYVVKPYDLVELIARIHAVARRARVGGPQRQERPGVLVRGSVRVDAGSRSVNVDERPVALTRKEFDVLFLLASSPGVVVRREQILSGVWGTNWVGAGRTLEVHVASLRQKLHRQDLIETVRGVGYRFVGPAA